MMFKKLVMETDRTRPSQYTFLFNNFFICEFKHLSLIYIVLLATIETTI
jgi:hypothetical protein